MRVGLALRTDAHPTLDSLRHVGASLRGALAAHRVSFLPHEAVYHPVEEQARMVEAFVAESDVVVGFAIPAVLEARKRLGLSVPFVLHLLGGLPRGAFGWRNLFPYLTERDVLVANSTADAALAAKLLENARVRRVPFSFDERRFYPLAQAERAAVRASLGFGPADRVLLYAGRITPEKNVHTVMRMFRALVEVVPGAHLVVAGSVADVAFHEMGVAPVRYRDTLDRAAARLGLPAGRVHLAGAAGADTLRALYNAADVAVNLTLHHDENFGLAQVEAMACGTPVVGTGWGGLRDTILDGVTGFKVSTAATPSGVKASWWEALNRAAHLLRDDEARARMGRAAREHALARYAPAVYRERMEAVVAEAADGAAHPAGPLRFTPFARDFWEACDPGADRRPPYRRGPRSAALYHELIGAYAEASPAAVPPGEPLAPAQVLSLAAPLAADEDGRLRPDDPLSPVPLEVPEGLRPAVRAALAALGRAPVVTAGALEEALRDAPCAAEAVRWLVAAGALLRTRDVAGWLAPGAVAPETGTALFTFQEVGAAGPDFLVY